MRRLPILVLSAVLFGSIGAVAGRTDAQTATTTPRPSEPAGSSAQPPSASPPPPGKALLDVFGMGHFFCQESLNYGGCFASFVVEQPGFVTHGGWQPPLREGQFQTQYFERGSDWVAGPPQDAPTTIDLGWSRLLAAIAGTSDMANPDGSARETGPFAVCTHDVLVTPLTRSLYVQVSFGDGLCSIDSVYDDRAAEDAPVPGLPMPAAVGTTSPRVRPDGRIHVVANSARLAPNTFYRYDLYEHCGLDVALFDLDGSLWAAKLPAADEPAFHDPIDRGAVAIDPVDPDHAVYVSPVGALRIDLERQPGALNLPICS